MAASLREGESPLLWVELDLDRDMRFAPGLLVRTSRRWLIWRQGGAVSKAAGPVTEGPVAEGPVAWPAADVAHVEFHEFGAVIEIELQLRSGVRECVASTAALSAAARQFVQQAARMQASPAPDAPPLAPACRRCGGPVGAEGACPECDETPAPPATRSLFRLLRFARPWAAWSAAGALLTITSTSAALVWPYLTGRLVDLLRGGDPQRSRQVLFILVGLAVASLAACLLGWARTWVLSWVSERISAELRNRTYEHLQRLSLSYFTGKRTGDLIARVGQDTDRICYFLSVNAIDFACDLLAIIITVIILLVIDPLFAAVTLAPLPLIVWLVHVVRNRLRGGFAAGSRAWGEMTAVLADTIPGIRVVKAFAQEGREVERFRTANRRVLDANDRVNRTWSLFGPLIVLLTDFGLLLVWSTGAWWVFRGRITVGELTAFALYLTRFYGRLESMSRMLAALQRAAASAHRVFEILDRPVDAPLPRRPVALGRVLGRLEFQDVEFRYGQRQVLRGVSLSIQPGEMIGLVGPSGSGKTTLINLACRFYDVSSGAILVDGVDLRDVPIEDYRRNIGLVLQEPFLFYGSIAENIAYGRPQATHREIIAAARAARAHDFILRQPDGYDALVGERGQQLSGGERQRLSIARALLIDPALLILDEATSAVDTETEREIQLALENLIRGRTTIAIAHRLSTLHKADRIVVLEDGRITEIGPHAELLARGGTYSRLYAAQVRHQRGEFGSPPHGAGE